jgi:hypothetical protein
VKAEGIIEKNERGESGRSAARVVEVERMDRVRCWLDDGVRIRNKKVVAATSH